MEQKGWGIAGHKNSYSRGVAVCNWNEDRFGEETIAARGGYDVDRFTAMAETRARFTKPAKMDDKQVRSFRAPPSGTYVQPKDGMVGRLLFAHGMEAHDPTAGASDHYATMSGTCHTLKGVRPTEVTGPARPGAHAEKVAHATRTEAVAAKKKKDALDRTAGHRFATTSQATQRLKAAGTHMMGHAGAPTGSVDISKPAGRQYKFTKTFRAQPHLRK